MYIYVAFYIFVLFIYTIYFKTALYSTFIYTCMVYYAIKNIEEIDVSFETLACAISANEL